MIFYDCPTAPSPRRARILLSEKNVPHQTVNIDLMSGEQLGEHFRAINPACTVPALKLDDGSVLTQNAGIAAYLESEYPEIPMLGRTSAEKGQVATWTAKVEFDAMMAIAEALRNSAPALQNRALPGSENYAQIPALVERGLARINVFYDSFDAHLSGREFVAIDEFSNADITAVVAIDFAKIIQAEPQAQHTNIARWRASLAGRASMAL